MDEDEESERSLMEMERYLDALRGAESWQLREDVMGMVVECR